MSFPRLKFIDYGSSTMSPTPYPRAVRDNLLQIAAVSHALHAFVEIWSKPRKLGNDTPDKSGRAPF